MRVGIDAFYLNHPFNGIGQVTVHLLNALQQATEQKGSGDNWPLASAATRSRLVEMTGGKCEFFLYLAQDTEFPLNKNFQKRIIPQKFIERSFSKRWWELRQLPDAVRQDRCDMLISLCQSAAVMPKSFPHVMIVHDIIYALSPEFTDSLSKRILLWLMLHGVKNASHYVAVSNYTKQDMVRHLGIKEQRISVAHIAADPQFKKVLSSEDVGRVLEKYQLAPGYLYHGGGLNERKNAKGVLEAYALLLAESRNGKLGTSLPPLAISGEIIRGLSNTTDLEALVKALGLSNYVTFLGRVPQADLPALYKGASVFLYPSRYEGFGLPVLEAMHQGTPVVTSNTSSLPEVGGQAVLYCDPDHPMEIAAAVRNILTDTNLKASLVQKGLERARVFTWEAFTSGFVETLAIHAKKTKRENLIL